MTEYRINNQAFISGFVDNKELTMAKFEEIILEQAKKGWRFVQLVLVPNEKAGGFKPESYKLIFERNL